MRKFLEARLPPAFGVTTGEIIDRADRRTGQLDLIIYDRTIAQPVLAGDAADLMPCEAVYAVIEVKSVLTKDDAEVCARAASKIRRLAPQGGKFIDSRVDGSRVADGEYRCMYMVFAYSSDLGEADWIQKEHERFEVAVVLAGASMTFIDRVVVLDRGLISPGLARGVVAGDNPVGLFGESYMHLVNFLERERGRRPDFSWQTYAAKGGLKWVKLGTTAKLKRSSNSKASAATTALTRRPKSNDVSSKPTPRQRTRRPPYQPGRLTPKG